MGLPVNLGTLTANGAIATPSIEPATQTDLDGDGVPDDYDF